jgi:hypothetical protein
MVLVYIGLLEENISLFFFYKYDVLSSNLVYSCELYQKTLRILFMLSFLQPTFYAITLILDMSKQYTVFQIGVCL